MSNSTGPGDSSLVSGARQQQQSSPALRLLGHHGITPSVERESPRRTNALVSRLPEKPYQGVPSLQTPVGLLRLTKPSPCSLVHPG